MPQVEPVVEAEASAFASATLDWGKSISRINALSSCQSTIKSRLLAIARNFI
jgi:hypothetical protein